MLKTTNSPAKMPPNNITNRLVAEINPVYLQVSYHYDVQGCTNAASSGRARAVDGAGRLLDRILSNGAITHYGWDAAGRLTQLKNTTITGQLVNNTQYSRDRLGNILSQTETVVPNPGVTTFSYDPNYRLLTADYPGTAHDEIFGYDTVGNRKTHTRGSLMPNAATRHYSYNNGNRLQSIRIGSPSGQLESTFIYNHNGQLLRQNGPRERNKIIAWNAQNRPRTINGSQFQYDPNGYRIRKTTGGQTQNYYLEGEHLEAIYDGDGRLTAQYLRGAVIDEVVNGYQKDGNDKLVNTTYHHDALQSVLGQSGHEGSVLAAQSYGAFGNVISQTGTGNNRLKYTGREEDSTGLYYYRARYYDPFIGRFISEDPLGFNAGDVNFYAYVGNNPVNANDPSGKIVVNPITIGATIGGVTGAIQAANAGGGWTVDNAGNIALGALTGAVAGAIPGAFATSIGLKATVAVGALAAGGGNLANQWAGGTSLSNTNWPQFSVQTGLGGISGLAGYGAGLSSALKVVRSGGSVEGALNFGNIYGALAGGATLTIANLPVSNDLGGFWSSTNLPVTNSANRGFVLYPNKSNTNQMQSVYSK